MLVISTKNGLCVYPTDVFAIPNKTATILYQNVLLGLDKSKNIALALTAIILS